VSAGIVEAVRYEVAHPLLAHIAERHRRAGRVLGWHQDTSREHANLTSGLP
jgi:hypothetical protein